MGVYIMWIVINDGQVRHRWECALCGEHTYVRPDNYGEIGIPLCVDCSAANYYDCEMRYVHTELECRQDLLPKP